ncbi:MAG: hypothetical protein WBY94_11705 [Polyangiaceae bacterium]
MSLLAIGCGSSDSQVASPVGGGSGGAGALEGSSGSGMPAPETSGSSGTGVGSGTGTATSTGGAVDSGTSGDTGSSGGVDGGSAASSVAQGGAGGSSGSGASGASCAPQTRLTLAAKISLAVTWPATTAANAGSGTALIWLLQDYAVNGTALSGSSQICGLSLPDIQLSGLGQIAAGGAKVQIQIPPSVWAKTTMPTFTTTATQSGWDPQSTFAGDPSVALIGIGLPAGSDPATYAWPSSSWSLPQGTTFPDADGDMNPAVTATPLNGSGYVYPPTAIGLGGSAPVADQVFIASRNSVALSGTWTSCSDLSGAATVKLFDNHVVGCHISGGKACTTGAANTQADFLDQNRTIYAPGKATFVAKSIGASATCSDALAAIP